MIDIISRNELRMKVDIYNSTDDLVNNLNNVEKIVSCNNGRYLITTVSKCECCSQDVRLNTQVQVNYKIEIKLEYGDKITTNNL